MTLRIDVTPFGPGVAFHLAGRVRAENLGELERDIAREGGSVVLDLHEVTLVDVDVVRFLKNAEGSGIELVNCPPFVREWISRERDPDG